MKSSIIVLDIIASIINSLLIILLTAFLAKGTAKKLSSNVQGEYILRMPKFYQYMGIVSLLIVIPFTIFPFFETFDLILLIVIISVVMLFGGLGVLSLLYYRNHSLQFDASFIEVKNHWGKPKVAAWKEVEKVRFNSLSGLITIETNRGVKLKLHQHLVGLTTLLDQLELKGEINIQKLRPQLS